MRAWVSDPPLPPMGVVGGWVAAVLGSVGVVDGGAVGTRLEATLAAGGVVVGALAAGLHAASTTTARPTATERMEGTIDLLGRYAGPDCIAPAQPSRRGWAREVFGRGPLADDSALNPGGRGSRLMPVGA